MMTTEEIQERVRNWYATTTPEQQAKMWRLQRESWVRAFAPCEHGDPDWETCPHCLKESADRQAARGIEAQRAETAGLGSREPGPQDASNE